MNEPAKIKINREIWKIYENFMRSIKKEENEKNPQKWLFLIFSMLKSYSMDKNTYIGRIWVISSILISEYI